MKQKLSIVSIHTNGNLKLYGHVNSTKPNHALMKAFVFTSIEELESLLEQAKQQQANVIEANQKAEDNAKLDREGFNA